MRGPLLSGPVGHSTTLDRLCGILREHPPVAVLSSLWLAQALATEIPVMVLVEGDVRRAARRALGRSGTPAHLLQPILAAADLPLRSAVIGAVVIEGLAEIEQKEALDFLAGLLPALRPGGIVVALDGTKNPQVEARLSGLLVGACLTRITQIRPREGAVLTVAVAPPAAVLAVCAAS